MADPQVANITETESALRSPSGADLVLLLLLILVGFGVWAVMERVVSEALHDREPSEERIMDARGVTKQQTQLADLQNETIEMQKYLYAARVDQLKQHASVESFASAYPQLNSNVALTTNQAATAAAYQEAKRQEELASGVVASLETRLADLKTQRGKASADLSDSKNAADTAFRRANLRYTLLKKSINFIATLLIVLGLFWLVRIVLWKMARNRRMSTAEGFRPFVLALGALLILFAYDQFSFAGAAFIGILLLLFVLRRIKWPQKRNELVK